MLTTGTAACSASSASFSSDPVRSPIAATLRDTALVLSHGLAARELQLAGPHHDRVAAELHDPRLERGARAGRRVLEQERDAAALEHARGERLRLELERPVEQGAQ